MVIWYDKQGKPIKGSEAEVGSPAWVEHMRRVEELLNDKDYKVVAQTTTPGGKYWVSTVWLGLDHTFSWFGKGINRHPIIFETMVFSSKRNSWYEFGGKRRYTRKEYEQIRYETEAQARAGHAKMVKKYTKLETKLEKGA